MYRSLTYPHQKERLIHATLAAPMQLRRVAAGTPPTGRELDGGERGVVSADGHLRAARAPPERIAPIESKEARSADVASR